MLSIISHSVQFSRSVVSDSLRPHELQHTRPPCPSPTPRVRSDSHPSSQWCHPAISSSVVPFSSCPQPLPASESFPVSQLWGGQCTGVSALASFLPKIALSNSPLSGCSTVYQLTYWKIFGCLQVLPGLDESQARIKIAGRNINNLRYADDTTFMAEKLAGGEGDDRG